MKDLHTDLKELFSEMQSVNQGMYHFHYLDDCKCTACIKVERIDRILKIFEEIPKVTGRRWDERNQPILILESKIIDISEEEIKEFF